MTRVLVSIDETGRGSLKVGDLDMSDLVSGVSIQADAGAAARIVLTIPFAPFAADLEADVDLDEETIEALRELGWTKVEGDEQ